MERFGKTCGSFARKEVHLKLELRKVWLLKRLIPFKKDQVVCIVATRKMPSGHLRNWLHPLHAQGCKGKNSFERICLEKKAPDCPVHTRPTT
jgi:hypothetical protein